MFQGVLSWPVLLSLQRPLCSSAPGAGRGEVTRVLLGWESCDCHTAQMTGWHILVELEKEEENGRRRRMDLEHRGWSGGVCKCTSE